ncbi:glucokinase [Desulfosediminicola flagellatus]|uniref:glucokinase n=1 Tax=Desulfosediminicola flagellatus TaxID=2569541 RepID=UPI0010AD2C7F|nr:glucokinase [Desulfosediminicola flagellatus]
MRATLLAVDVGGTKCELALFDATSTSYQSIARKRYPSGNYERLEDIIHEFLQEFSATPSYSCMGIAGVVSGGVARVTNLPWVIDEQSVAREFHLSGLHLINDLTAVCASLSLLTGDELFEIQRGDVQQGQLIGVVAPGTGLGEGVLVQGENFFFPRGSEGGHTDFGPVDEEQTELLKWMLRRRERVSYESLIAGPGIPNLYDFYREQIGMAEMEHVRDQMSRAADRTPIIFDNAFGDNPCPLCGKVVDLFLNILGAEAGNLALKLYARGGIYIGGGIVPRIADRVSFDGFLANFLAKGKMAQLMTTIPVNLIRKKDAALIGAARYGLEMLAR